MRSMVLVQWASTNQITAAKQDINNIVFIQHLRVGYTPIFNYCVFTIGGGGRRIKEHFKERLNNYSVHPPNPLVDQMQRRVVCKYNSYRLLYKRCQPPPAGRTLPTLTESSNNSNCLHVDAAIHAGISLQYNLSRQKRHFNQLLMGGGGGR